MNESFARGHWQGVKFEKVDDNVKVIYTLLIGRLIEISWFSEGFAGGGTFR